MSDSEYQLQLMPGYTVNRLSDNLSLALTIFGYMHPLLNPSADVRNFEQVSAD